MLGCGASARVDSSKVSSATVGQGRTVKWNLPALDYGTTVCVCFDITADNNHEKSSQEVRKHLLFSRCAHERCRNRYLCVKLSFS